MCIREQVVLYLEPERGRNLPDALFGEDDTDILWVGLLLLANTGGLHPASYISRALITAGLRDAEGECLPTHTYTSQ